MNSFSAFCVILFVSFATITLSSFAEKLGPADYPHQASYLDRAYCNFGKKNETPEAFKNFTAAAFNNCYQMVCNEHNNKTIIFSCARCYDSNQKEIIGDTSKSYPDCCPKC